MLIWIKKHSSKLIAAMLICIAAYALSRLYFNITGGFTLANIQSELAFDSKRESPLPSDEELSKIRTILAMKYRYLGKGCQSYVFISEDGEYVIKFLKYQRFRPKAFLHYLTFVPGVDQYLQKKILQKKEKLDKLFDSWKIAYQHLSQETGIIFLHLNKTSYLNAPLHIYDKMGLKHILDTDQMEFLIQKRAEMLCPVIEKKMANNDIEGTKTLLTNLVDMIISEYQRGYADNDHALMQNTGVYQGSPVHIDVGQFISDEKMKDRDYYELELFSKTYKFRIWLRKHFPPLEEFLTAKLYDIIGPKMSEMKPRLKTIDEGA